MSYRVAIVTPIVLRSYPRGDKLELKVRIEEDDKWVTTKRIQCEYPVWFEDLEHDLMVELDVGNIRFQHHLEYFIPRKHPELQD